MEPPSQCDTRAKQKHASLHGIPPRSGEEQVGSHLNIAGRSRFGFRNFRNIIVLIRFGLAFLFLPRFDAIRPHFLNVSAPAKT